MGPIIILIYGLMIFLLSAYESCGCVMYKEILYLTILAWLINSEYA